MALYQAEYWTRTFDNDKDCFHAEIKAISPMHALKQVKKLRKFIFKIHLTKL